MTAGKVAPEQAIPTDDYLLGGRMPRTSGYLLGGRMPRTSEGAETPSAADFVIELSYGSE